MPHDRAAILQRHGELKADKAREEPIFRALARILRPDDQEFGEGERRDRERADTYDSAPLLALNNFVNGLYSDGMNPADRWCAFALENTDLMKRAPVKQWCWDFGTAFFNSIEPQRSRFYTEMPSSLADTGSFGTGCIYQEEGVGRGTFIDRAAAIGRLYIGRNADGDVDIVHNAMPPIKGRVVKRTYKNLPDSVRDDQDYSILHCVYPNTDYNPRLLGPRGMLMASTFLCTDIRDWQQDGGYHELPYHFLEWDARAGKTWCRGPGHDALADMEMNDEMQRSILTATQFEAEPVWLTANDGIMTAADIEPGAVLDGAVSEQGKELAKRLDRGENLAIPIAVAEATRRKIQDAFGFSLSTIAGRPQMTLGEFAGWKEENLRLKAPHLVRIQRGLASFVMRRVGLLWRAKKIPAPPPEIVNEPMQIVFVSPFARAQMLAEARGAIQYADSLMRLAEFQPDAMDNLDGDVYAAIAHKGFSSQPGLIRDPRAVEKIRAGRAQAQQQGAGIEQAAVLADIKAKVAHADQAQTRATQRSRAA